MSEIVVCKASPMSAAVEVVVAVIVRNGRLLLTQRRADKSYPWTWESPGGKVEAGEPRKQALVRELREELGCESIIEEYRWEFSLEPPDTRRAIRVALFATSLVGDPRPLVTHGLGWFGADELQALPLTPANQKARSILKLYLLERDA